MSQPSLADRDRRVERRLMAFAVGAGMLAAVIGLFYLVVWLSSAMPFHGLHMLAMKTNTALCALLCGVATALAVPRDPGRVRLLSARFLALLAAAVAGLTLLEHLLGWDIGIDQLLVGEPPGSVGDPHPNRMGPPAAVSFPLCSIAILLLLSGKQTVVRWVQTLGFVLSCTALLASIAYLYRVEGILFAPRFSIIALPTAVSILLLGIGLLLARPRQGVMAAFTSSSPGGVAIRQLLVPAIVLPILLGWLRLQGEMRGYYGVTLGTSVLVLSWIVIFSFLVYQIGKRYEAQLKAEEEVRAQDAVRESENRLRSIIDNMAEGLVVVEPGTGALHWNRKALEMYDYEAEADEIVFLDHLADIFELKTLDGRELPLEQWPVRRILRGEELQDVDLLVTDKKRNLQRIYSYSGTLIRDTQGKPQLGIVTLRDVTLRKEAEEAVRESEEKFRAVFQQAAVGMARVSFSDARWVDVNDALCNMLGYTHAEMAATPWPQMTHPEDLDLDLIPFRQMAAGKLDNYSVEKRFIHKDGRHVWARLTLSLVRNAQGLPDYEIAIIEDITARKEAEEAVRKAKDELEQRVRERTRDLERAYLALKRETEQRLAAVDDLREKEQLLVQQTRLAAMGEVLGNIAHEWRQPLNTLGLLIQHLQLTYNMGHFNAEFLEGEVDKAMNLIKHMSHTISDFKDFLKQEKETQPFSVNNAVVTTLSLLESPLRALNVETEVVQSDELTITGHRNEFSHVILNLITNARDAFRDRGVTQPKITIRIFREEGKSVVTVADNAGGIPEEIVGKVFDPYFTTKTPDKGTGIGLYMSKNIIEKSMGGALSVRNTVEGAEFRIEF